MSHIYTSWLKIPAVKWAVNTSLLLLRNSSDGKKMSRKAVLGKPHLPWTGSGNVQSTSEPPIWWHCCLQSPWHQNLFLQASLSAVCWDQRLWPSLKLSFYSQESSKQAQREITDYVCTSTRCPRIASPTLGQEHELLSEDRVLIWVQFGPLWMQG